MPADAAAVADAYWLWPDFGDRVSGVKFKVQGIRCLIQARRHGIGVMLSSCCQKGVCTQLGIVALKDMGAIFPEDAS